MNNAKVTKPYRVTYKSEGTKVDYLTDTEYKFLTTPMKNSRTDVLSIEPASRLYYTLLIWDNGRWGPQFGDFERKVVDQERKDSYPGLSRKKWSIIRTTDSQRDIDNMVAAANGGK